MKPTAPENFDGDAASDREGEHFQIFS